MRLKWGVVLVVAVLGVVPATATASGGLQPGGLTKFKERVPVNVVFVGFDDRDVPWAKVRSELANGAQPLVRSREPYGITEKLGLDYTFDYTPYYTSKSWEDSFFGYLSSIAVKKPLTEWQQTYNDQANNVLDVTDNRWIDAPKVEKRLIDNAPASIDTRRPTIFFINWWGRKDFKFHVYAKTGEPDPDTGYDFGANRDTRKIVAWGGTTPDDEETGLGNRGVNRVWFYDLSAGPENWGGNFDVDDADLDGDGVADYRIPVSWEYGSYRKKSELPRDLGKVVRYVGLNLLFASSPLYPPYFTADRDPGPRRSRHRHVRGLGGHGRVTLVHQGAAVPAGGARAADRLRLHDRLAGPAVRRRLQALLRGRVPARPRRRPVHLLPAAGPVAGREPVPGGGEAHQPVPRG